MFSVLFLWFFSSFAFADEIHARCIRVLDGDTIEVEVGIDKLQKVRLAQIDAPEKNQDYGIPSKVNLADMILNRDVVVTYDKIDRYGRIIGQIYVEGFINGRVERVDINFAQVHAGLAWVYKQYPHTQEYLEEEADARKEQRGLWKDPYPLAPWDFRRERRK